jgi:hypothetical protein
MASGLRGGRSAICRAAETPNVLSIHTAIRRQYLIGELETYRNDHSPIGTIMHPEESSFWDLASDLLSRRFGTITCLMKLQMSVGIAVVILNVWPHRTRRSVLDRSAVFFTLRTAVAIVAAVYLGGQAKKPDRFAGRLFAGLMNDSREFQ